MPSQGHVAIHVDDLAAALAALADAGFGHEERRAHWGAPRHYAHAPGGHVVEVFEIGPQTQS